MLAYLSSIIGARRNSAPRNAEVKPKEIRFSTVLGTSHLALGKHVTGEVDGDLLHLTFEGNQAPAPHITYQAIPN